MMQVSAVTNSSVDFAYSQGNISVSLSSLRVSQFDIDTVYLNYGDFTGLQVKEWALGSNNAQNYTVYNLDTSTFDYVTLASTYQIQTQASLNFSY
jgi:hypothetical protein